jgi:phage shock protein A
MAKTYHRRTIPLQMEFTGRISMSIFKRVYTTVFSSIDQMVGEIENHDALIQAAIKEQCRKIATAKIQLSRLRGSENRVQEQLTQLRRNEALWTARATADANADEQKALACLQHRRVVMEQISGLERSRLEYANAAKKMSADIGHCDEQLKALRQKYDLMRARQSSADALTVIDDVGGLTIDELALSFERWETNITIDEVRVDRYVDTDSFEQTYIDEENMGQLRTELADLLIPKDQSEGTTTSGKGSDNEQ